MYKVKWEEEPLEYLSKLDEEIEKLIKERVENHLASHPLQNGKVMWGKWAGFYRYRIDKYRVIFELKENKLMILVVKVGERKQGQKDGVCRS